MAVKASNNKITDNVGPVEITTGSDPQACYESFKAVRTAISPSQNTLLFVTTVKSLECGRDLFLMSRDFSSLHRRREKKAVNIGKAKSSPDRVQRP